MRLYSNKLKYKNFCSVFIENSGYIGPKVECVDKSLYPFLLGHRDKICYLDIYANLGGLGDSFRVVCDIVSDRGKMLLVGGDLCFVSVLLCLSNLESFNIVVTPWDFLQVRNKLHLDLVLVHEVDNVSVLESESKYSPYIVVNGTTVKGVPYPCNISLRNSIVSNWYLYSLVNSCRKGVYLRSKNLNEI